MRSHRASAVALSALGLGAALAFLAGCASSRLSSEAPPGEHLAGDWKLDAARSDDLGSAIGQLRAQSAKARRRQRKEQQQEFGNYERRGPGGAQGGQEGGESEGESPSDSVSGGQGFGPGPMPQVSAVDELMSNVPRGEYLRIAVSDTSFIVTSGDSSSQYTPGLESEVSAQLGDAQQIAGWKGPGFVIDTTPQWGPRIIQSFTLTKDGKLAMVTRLSGGGIDFTFTRLYDRTTRVAPLAPPTTN